MRKVNYHTHTTRCHHAAGSDEEYVLSAIKNGYQELGFSDHAPWKYQSNFVARIRMTLDEFDEYYQSISNLREKYKNQIKIYIGLESEYFPAYMTWMKQFILDKKLDYIILGNHFYQSDETGIYFGSACKDPKNLTLYVDQAIEAMKTGLYSYLAHPDLFMRSYPTFDAFARKESIRLCQGAKDLDIPLEYNLEGLAHDQQSGHEEYPHTQFWEIVKEVGNHAIIGVDAHSNKSLETDLIYNEALKRLQELEIPIIDYLPLKLPKMK